MPVHRTLTALDADVLEGAIMPAVDNRHPDGICWDDLDLDPAGSLAARLADTIVDAFSPE